jgi:hypothetical protein
MTTQRRDGCIETSFARWTRTNAALDSRKEGVAVLDVDRIWHRYRSRADKLGERKLLHAMLIEEKSNMAKLTFDQLETLWCINQEPKKLKEWPAITPRGEKVIFRWWGCFYLQYSGGEITVSDEIYWGNFYTLKKRRITLQKLERILLFDLDPVTLRERDDRRHHAEHPRLPGVEQ